MAKQVLTGAKLYVDGYDLSGDHNALALQYGADAVEQTVLSSTTHVFAPGLKTVSASHAGLWSGGTDNVDDVLFARMGLANAIATIGPMTGAEGEPAFFATMLETNYSPSGSIGDAFGFTVDMQAAADLYRGTVLHNATRTATGTGTIYQLGAVSATQRVSAVLHVLGPVTGGTPVLTVKVQSAALVGFGSPTDRITFAAKSAPGAEQVTTVIGAITDQFWRASWVISGSGPPSFPFVVAVSIQ